MGHHEGKGGGMGSRGAEGTVEVCGSQEFVSFLDCEASLLAEYIYHFTCFCRSSSRGGHFGSVGYPPIVIPSLEPRLAQLRLVHFVVPPPLLSSPDQQNRCSRRSFRVPTCRSAGCRTPPQPNLVFF